jgi:hypothetical protein
MTSNARKFLVHYLAKVGVEGSNPFARSNNQVVTKHCSEQIEVLAGK